LYAKKGGFVDMCLLFIVKCWTILFSSLFTKPERMKLKLNNTLRPWLRENVDVSKVRLNDWKMKQFPWEKRKTVKK